MELIDVLHILRRRWLIIVLVTLSCLAGAAVATTQQTKMYQTGTRLIVSGVSSVAALDETTRRELATRRAVAYSQIATTSPAVNAALVVAARAPGVGGPGGPAVVATASGKDPFLDITVTDRNPARAAAVANAYTRILPRVIANLEGTPANAQSDIAAISAAGVPSKPSSPKPIRNGLIGLIVGLVLGLGSAFVRESLDRRLRDSDEVERAAGVSVLGVVPREDLDSRIPVETHPMSARAEAYRKVRTNLTFTSASGMPRSILITSSTSGEGKTTLAANLALACARTGFNVLLIDADLRRPTVGAYLEIATDVGLTNILTHQATLQTVRQPFRGTGVDVITSGPIPPNPSELLGSSVMSDLLYEADKLYDIVVVDAPPVLPVADALVLAVFVEAVVLVAKVGDTTRDRLRRSKDAVLKVNGNLVGVVPNAVIQREDSAYAYAYRYKNKGCDSLELYTKQARLPEIDEQGRPLTVPATPTTPRRSRP